MVRPGQMISTLAAAGRNRSIRLVELSWGAAIAAEWAHFVALGVYAYDHGGTSAVGVAGLVRLLPAAVIAPLAASLGDRFQRELVLLAMTLMGAAALAASTIAFFAGSRLLVFAFAAVLGLATTLIRPALQALLPSLARTPEELIAANGATSTIESLGTLVGRWSPGSSLRRRTPASSSPGPPARSSSPPGCSPWFASRDASRSRTGPARGRWSRTACARSGRRPTRGC